MLDTIWSATWSGLLEPMLTGLATILTIWGLGVTVSRPLNLHFSVVRRVIATGIALAGLRPITEAILPDGMVATDQGWLAFWYTLLGFLTAVLLAMVFLVVAESLLPTGSVPGPFALARSWPRRWRRTRRYARFVAILLRHGLAPYVFSRQRPDMSSPGGRRHVAVALRRSLEEAGVVSVKFGQFLSTRRDLLPDELIDELSRLHADAQPIPWTGIEPALERRLARSGADLASTFSSIDEAPLASASVAQVHAARLRTGEDVVVKVRRPGAKVTVAGDLDILRRLADRVERTTSWGRSLGIVVLVEGFAASLEEELDFRVEAGNISRITAASEALGTRDISYPTVFRAEESLLVMGRLHGMRIDTTDGGALADRGVDHAWLATGLLHTILAQILLGGVFHADPHPGNILLLDETDKLAMLDFGSVGRVDTDLQKSLQRLLMAFDRNDSAAAAAALLGLVDAPERLDKTALRRSLGRFMARNLGPGNPPTAAMFTDLFRVITSHRLSVPTETAAIFRSLATVEGTVRTLSPDFDVVASAKQFAAAQLRQQLSPWVGKEEAMGGLSALLPVVSTLPHRVDRVLQNLESVSAAGAPSRLATIVPDAVQLIALSMITATTGIMATLLLTSSTNGSVPDSVTAHQMIGYPLLIVSSILGLRTLVSIFTATRADKARVAGG